jgi:hypothetical protein
MSKKFIVGVANAYYYDTSSNLIFESKTMLDDSIEITTGNTEIRGGQGNGLQFVYYHTSAFSVTLTETQFKLEMIAASVGASIITGNDVWTDEEVTLGGGGAGTVLGTPKVTPDATSTIYGYVRQTDGTVTRVTFTGSNFTLAGGTSGEVVCVRYYVADAASRSVTISSNFIPKVGRLVLDAQLGSNDSVTSDSIIGKIQIEIPRAQLSGASTISMTADGVANQPLTAMATEYQSTGCGTGRYAKITEIITNANWYDNVKGLYVADADVDLVVGGSDQTLDVIAIPYHGEPFTAPLADLTFASSDATKATVGLHTGVCHAVAAGSSTITITITAKPAVSANALVTVTI